MKFMSMIKNRGCMLIKLKYITNKGCGAVDVTAPSLIKSLSLNPEYGEILGRKCFPLNEALCSTNSK